MPAPSALPAHTPAAKTIGSVASGGPQGGEATSSGQAASVAGEPGTINAAAAAAAQSTASTVEAGVCVGVWVSG
jgi:hypothetical protein